MNTNGLNMQSGFHPDTLIKYCSSIRSLAGRYQQIFGYTGLNQYANAIAITDSITNHYRLENEQNVELNNTKDFIYFLEALHNDGRNVAQLDSSEIATLTLISNKESGGQTASRAENILCFFYDLCKKEMGSPKSNSVKTNKPKPTDKELYEGLNTVKERLISPMPEYMIDMLYASRDETTLRTAMESALGDLFFEVERIQKIVISETMLEDSTAFERDSVIYFLSLIKTVEGNYSRVAALSAKGQNAAAIQLLDSMLNNYKLPEYRMLECNAMKSFYQLLGSVESAARNMATLESGEINFLQNIATDPAAGLASQKARNVLCFHYNICYDNKGKPKSNEVPVPKATKEEILKKLNAVSVFPNPTDQYVTIEYSLLKSMEETTIAIYDATGRLLEQRPLGNNYKGQVLLDTRKYANGLIIFEIKQDGKKVSEGKFIVVH